MSRLEGVYIQRVQKQHSSLIVVIPIAVRRALGLKAKDYVVFADHTKSGIVELNKFEPGGQNNGKDSRDSGREDSGRRKRAQDGV